MSALARWPTARTVLLVLVVVLVIDILLPPLALMTWTIPLVLGLYVSPDNRRTARALFVVAGALVLLVVVAFLAVQSG
jgi:hypothetical protein